ncbi:MAG TPA: hypothetical protein VFI84_01210 [Candidatus Saccharimonadales bacterium]|nr:hypothetical protein [Candidatus Saccharimonadales bacterium]
MDFNSRASQPAPAPSGAPFGGAASKKTKVTGGGKWARWGTAALFLAVVVLVVAALLAFSFGGQKAEGSYVDSKKLQAVFLNTGQVYFGDIKTLNSKYLVLDNIYYLQTSGGSQGTSSSANTSVSLVKLGCELHSPYDRMVINRDQVTFWENLQDSGQVAQAVAKFVKDNPNGQKCADQSQSTNTTTNTNAVQGSSNTSTSNTTSTKP